MGLRLTANPGSRMASVVSIDWSNVTGKPLTITGLGNLVGTGFVTATDLLGDYAARTITGTANEITVTNGDGIAGNPVVSLPTALTFTGKTITGGTYTSVVSINGNFWTAGTGRLTLGAGKTATINNTLTLAGTDGTTMTFPTTSATLARTDAANTFTGHQTIEGVTSTGATGTGNFVFDGTPTLVTPVLGVATATTVNKVTITAPASAATLTLIDGTVLTGPASSGTVMTLGNTETVTGLKTFGSAGAVGRFKLAGTTSGTTVLDATAIASGTLTLPAATDTLMGKATTDIMTNKTFNSTAAGNVLAVGGVNLFTGQYPGETTTGNATAGNIGEVVTSTIASGSAVGLTTSTPANITSISLTAGDWDVTCAGGFTIGATTSVTVLQFGPSSVSATITNGAGSRFAFTQNAATMGATQEYPSLGPVRFSLSGTTTIFFVAAATFTVSTVAAYCKIYARRMR